MRGGRPVKLVQSVILPDEESVQRKNSGNELLFLVLKTIFELIHKKVKSAKVLDGSCRRVQTLNDLKAHFRLVKLYKYGHHVVHY